MKAPSPNRFFAGRPMTGIAIAFAAGTWCGARYVPGIALTLAAAATIFVLWLGAFFLSKRRYAWNAVASVFVLAFVFCAACLPAATASASRMDTVEELRDIVEERADTVLRGTIETEPSLSITQNERSVRTRFTFLLREIPDEFGGVRVNALPIRVDWYGPLSLLGDHKSFPVPQAGEGWQLCGRLKETPSESAVPILTLSIRGGDKRCRIAPEHRVAKPVSLLYMLRRRAAQTLSLGPEKNAHAAGIVKAMTLGYRSEIPYDVAELFRQSGTIHIFAISGMHVMIVAMLIRCCVSLFGFSWRTQTLLCIALVGAYVLATGARPSAIRAGLMTGCYMAAPLFHRKSDALSAIATAAIIILSAAPLQIFDLGFILSFVCVLGIVLLCPPLNATFARLAAWRKSREDDAFEYEFADDPVPRGFFAQAGNCATKYFGAIFVTSVAAWLASAPITAMFFGRLAPVSILCNLLILPAAFGIVTIAALSIACGIVAPDAAALLNRANAGLASFMEMVAAYGLKLPFASVEIPPWSAADVALWYATLALVFLIPRGIRFTNDDDAL